MALPPVVGSSVAPAMQMFKVTANDNNDLSFTGANGVTVGVARGLLVGTAGAADIIDGSGNLCPAVPLQQGYNPIYVQRVKATNLVASNIWAIY